MTKLAFTASELELQQLRRCAAGEDISSSDRESDKARQRLRRAGLLTFSRPGGWMVTNAGRSFLDGTVTGGGSGGGSSQLRAVVVTHGAGGSGPVTRCAGCGAVRPDLSHNCEPKG